MNKQAFYRIILLMSLLVVAFIAVSVCDAIAEQNQKQLSLGEYLSETNESWFLTGKNQYTVQAMMVSREMTYRLTILDERKVYLVATFDVVGIGVGLQALLIQHLTVAALLATHKKYEVVRSGKSADVVKTI